MTGVGGTDPKEALGFERLKYVKLMVFLFLYVST